VIATCATLLFVPTKYALFLRWVGYGGGLPVRVDIRDDRLGSVTYDGYLMLRTSDAVILFRDAEMRFFEFPNAHIRGLSHPTGGLTSLPSKLPPAE